MSLNLGITGRLVGSKIAMKVGVESVTALCRPMGRGSAYVFMQKKMLFRKLVESVLVLVLYCTVIRRYITLIFMPVLMVFGCSCPCERCTIKIIQSGVKEVVYNLEYKV
jgi:hypothetical protein